MKIFNISNDVNSSAIKLLTLFVLLFFTSSSIYADGRISKGQSQVNAGLGFSGWGVPVYVGLDYGIHPDITVGGELSYRRYSDTYLRSNYSHNIIGILGNANYHFNRVLKIPSKWDFYAGLNLGFYIWNTSDSNYHGSGSSGLGLGAQVGGRYYLNKSVILNLELGGANTTSGTKLGVTFKL